MERDTGPELKPRWVWLKTLILPDPGLWAVFPWIGFASFTVRAHAELRTQSPPLLHNKWEHRRRPIREPGPRQGAWQVVSRLHVAFTPAGCGGGGQPATQCQRAPPGLWWGPPGWNWADSANRKRGPRISYPDTQGHKCESQQKQREGRGFVHWS